MTCKTEDVPPSSIHIDVSNACIDMNSVGNPESDGLSLSQQLANELDESPVKKRKAHSMANIQISWLWDHFEKIEERKHLHCSKYLG